MKTYEYKVYTGNTYKGLLNNVVSEFGYSQTINTIGTELSIDIAIGFGDVGAEVDADTLVTENGDFIVTEVGNNIATRLEYVFNNAPLEMANRIKVVEFSDRNPSGIQVFDGIITKWNANFDQDVIQISAFNYGYQLGQYVITESGDLNIDQPEYDDEDTLTAGIGKEAGDAFMQTFDIAIETDIRGVYIYAKKSIANAICFVNAVIYEGTPDSLGSLLAGGTQYINSTSFAKFQYDFGETVTLPAGTYTLALFSQAGGGSYDNPIIAINSTDPYANGAWYKNYVEQTGYDLAFGVTNSTNSVLYPFSGIDSGNGVRQAMLIYNNQGGLVSYSTDTVETTGVSMYYDFNIATVKEIIDKALSVSPASYFYYVDPSDNTLYFKDRAITPDHIFKRGYELTSIALERTIDEMQNTVFFSGGDSGSGENLLVLSQNVASVTNYGKWTAQLSDNRVTVQTTAEKFAQATLDANSEPKYRLVVEVNDSKYDTSTISLGDMIKITNNGNLLDEILLQVVEKTIKPYSVVLKLGSIQPRTTSTIERLSQQLALQEKENNPEVLT